MASQKELELGRLAVANQILSQEALDECLATQDDSGRPLSLILIDRGYLDDKEIELLVDLYQRKKERTAEPFGDRELEDVLFANLAVTGGHVDLEDLVACVGEREKGGEDARRITLGQMLVKKKVLGVQNFLELARQTEDQTFQCWQCGSQERLGGQRAGREFACAACGAELRVPRMKDLIDHLQKQVPAASEDEGKGQSETKLDTRRVVDGMREGAASLKPGDLFDGAYRIVYEIARGGMGVVYRAEQLNLGRPVALKIIRGAGSSQETRIQRFRREAQAIGRLRHPGIVQIYNVGETGGCHYLAMEFLEGRSLDKVIEVGELPPLDATRIVRDLAQAVAYAHAQGVLHRDLKPSNVILDAGSRPRLTDFGLAKLVGRDPGLDLTRSGDIVGTPFYIPPELIEKGSRTISESGDIYGLGVIYYQLLTGKMPFTGTTSVEVYHRILREQPVPPRKLVPGVRRAMEVACLKAMARDPAERHGAAAELAEDLDRILGGQDVRGGTSIRPRTRRMSVAVEPPRTSTRPVLLWIAGIAIALVAAGWLGAWWYFRRGGEVEEPSGQEAPKPPPRTEAEEREAAYLEALDRGKAAYDQESWTEAIEWSEKALAIHPTRHESFAAGVRMGLSQLRLEDAKKARESIEGALKVQGLTATERGAGLHDLALVLFELDEREDALAALDAALAADPAGLGALKTKAMFLDRLGRRLEAIAIYRDLHDRLPQDPEVAEYLSDWDEASRQSFAEMRRAYEAKDWDGALAAGRRAALYHTEGREAYAVWDTVGHASYMKKDFAAARDALERALLHALVPADIVKTKKNLGAMLYNLGDPQRALALTEEAITTSDDDDDVDAYCNVVVFLRALKRSEEAKAIVDRLRAQRPDDPKVKAIAEGGDH